MIRSFRYKARLSPSAVRKAEAGLDVLCEIYNAGLEERKTAWEKARVTIGFYAQSKQIKDVRRDRPELGALPFDAAEVCLRRLHRAFEGFFRRVKAGQTPGYPRFRARGRFDSMTFRGCGWKLAGNRLTLQGVGTLKLFLSRPVEGRVKTVTLRRDRCGDWFVTFACDDIPIRPLPATGESIGVDVGLVSFLTTSDGQHIANPRHLAIREAAIKRAQRIISKRTKGGVNRRKAVRLLAKRHRTVQRARRDFHFKTAHALVQRYDLVAVEDLNVAGLARGRLSKSIHDAGWAGFLHALRTKAEEAGRSVVTVDPRGTSQCCSGCGAEVRKALSVRVHDCPHCGLVLDRDENAARNILQRARAAPTGSRPAQKVAA